MLPPSVWRFSWVLCTNLCFDLRHQKHHQKTQGRISGCKHMLRGLRWQKVVCPTCVPWALEQSVCSAVGGCSGNATWAPPVTVPRGLLFCGPCADPTRLVPRAEVGSHTLLLRGAAYAQECLRGHHFVIGRPLYPVARFFFISRTWSRSVFVCTLTTRIGPHVQLLTTGWRAWAPLTPGDCPP